MVQDDSKIPVPRRDALTSDKAWEAAIVRCHDIAAGGGAPGIRCSRVRGVGLARYYGGLAERWSGVGPDGR
jgi:hypothetical protein